MHFCRKSHCFKFYVLHVGHKKCDVDIGLGIEQKVSEF